MLLIQAMMQQQQRQQQPNQQANGGDDLEKLLKQVKQANDIYNDVGDATTSVGSLFGPTFSEATQAAWNQAAGEASQAAWNAGADAASGVSSAGTAGAEGAGTSGAGTNYAGWAAAALSAYNDYKKLTGDNLTDEQKALEGSRAIPRAVAAYYTGGLSNLAEGYARKQWGGTMAKLDKLAMKTDPFMIASRLWTSDKWKTEGNRLKKLSENGVDIPEALRGPMTQQRGRKTSDLIRKDLPADFIGKDARGNYVNNKFATSRKESDLKPEDIWGYSAFLEKYGNDWLGKFNEDQRRKVAQEALDQGAVNEHHGTIDIKWNPDLESRINGILGSQAAGKPSGNMQKKPGQYGPGESAATVANAVNGKGNSNYELARNYTPEQMRTLIEGVTGRKLNGDGSWRNLGSNDKLGDLSGAGRDNFFGNPGTIPLNLLPNLTTEQLRDRMYRFPQDSKKPGGDSFSKSTMDALNSLGLGKEWGPIPKQNNQPPQWQPGQTVRLSPGVYRGPDGKLQYKTGK